MGGEGLCGWGCVDGEGSVQMGRDCEDGQGVV